LISHLLPYKNSVISFQTAGVGRQLLFCFHGFAEDAGSFHLFEKLLDDKFTLIALDFPFHGKTVWKEELLFSPADLLEIMSAIIAHLSGDNVETTRYSILGYSLGGRVAFQLLQLAPEKIDRIVLAAPDGLIMNFWYWLGTQTSVGNRLFKFTMHNPAWFFALVKAGHRTGLVNKSVFKFVCHYINDETARLDLYQRWTTMRRFKPDFKQILPLLNNYPVKLTLFFGTYDRIILKKQSDFLTAACPLVNVKTLNAGHQLLRGKYVPEIAAAFSE